MKNSTVTPIDIFENPEAWFAGFGISVTDVSSRRACRICAGDDLHDRIAA